MRADRYPVYVETFAAAAITVIAGFLGLATPLFFLAVLLMPLPVAYLIVKRDLNQGLLSLALASMFLLSIVGRFDLLLLLMLHFGPPAVIIGLLIKNKTTVVQSVYILFFWALAASTITLAFIYSVGYGDNGAASEVNKVVEQMSEYYMAAGIIDEEGRRQLDGISQQLGRLAQLFLPASVIVWTSIMVNGTYFIARRLFSKLGYSIPGGVKFSEWRLPWYSVWLVIAGLALTLAGDEFSLHLGGAIGKNILFVSAFIFFIQGISVMAYFLQVWRIPGVVKVIIALAVFLYMPFIILALGLIDPVANLRRLPGNGGEGTKGG